MRVCGYLSKRLGLYLHLARRLAVLAADQDHVRAKRERGEQPQDLLKDERPWKQGEETRQADEARDGRGQEYANLQMCVGSRQKVTKTEQDVRRETCITCSVSMGSSHCITRSRIRTVSRWRCLRAAKFAQDLEGRDSIVESVSSSWPGMRTTAWPGLSSRSRSLTAPTAAAPASAEKGRAAQMWRMCCRRLRCLRSSRRARRSLARPPI